ncbi:MAG TPA: N-6 DNA methylase, partial [Negativicutes bacterium]|nr:N-6 DNA methylase [Negativicutes bacterium]
MQISDITLQTKSMIDDLKAICTNYGLGNASSEYKIITEVFLYKFLNDKFIYEARQVVPKFQQMAAAEVEAAMSAMPEDDYELMLLDFGAATARLKREHYISYLFNRKNQDGFHALFDDMLIDIANYNINIFSVQTGGQSKIRLFDSLSQFVIEQEKKDSFCRAIIDKLANCSFDCVFDQKYDFFAAIFEYLIKDYNKDFGKYGEYYTPHTIASIIAKVMVTVGVQNVTVYDPAAGSGTLVLALAHEIGESNCTIFTQDISQKSNEFLRLNLILNNLVHSLPNVVHDDTLLNPRHLNYKKDKLATFDYIVSNPPFNMDFSDSRNTLSGEKYA